ncbi:complex i intermediate-associated protein 30 [Diplodia corticola]|uniref:Complex i intermediate-associated protein 30 n=1 Tax=Diplodia corticola TaxID=236234 RepID=A0A1J9SD38_9PEZI|nr:complex i intermediate-associated protein 30 [Diplodia corticola]OJD37485.1 complex i intermediate-associated protein 30 [Diplodia corticola]
MKGAAPLPLVTFSDASSIDDCKRMSDADLGGYSEVDLDFVPQSGISPPHARFRGNISIQLPQHNPHVSRTGYAGWRTRDRPATLFGKSLFDLDPYRYLALRVKSDGRKYFVNVQTESVVPTDIHQHRLYARKPGEWETVLIKLSEFVRTNHGVPVEPQKEMMRQRVRSVGISLTDRVPGPYELCIGKIWATNELSDSESAEDARVDAITKAPSNESRAP